MSDEKDNKKKLGDYFRKGVQGLRDRANFDNTDLIRAVDKGDEEMVGRILYAGVAPNQKDALNRRALPMAVDNNNATIVELLLKAKADPNLPGKNGDLPLRKAVYWNNKSIAMMLLQAGASKDMPNQEGVSAMLEAKRNSNQAMMKLMDDFKNPKRIRQIARDKRKHLEQKGKMAAAKAKLKEEQEKAIKAQQERLTKIAENLEAKYHVAEKGYIAALIDAINAKDGKATKMFIDKTENLNQFTKKGFSPLLVAIRNRHNNLASYLLEKGADPFLTSPKQDHNPFSKAVSEDLTGFMEKVVINHEEQLAKYCNDKDRLLSPQFLAYKSPKMFDLLLGAGADPLWGGKEGVPPVIKAMEKGSIALLPVLTKHKFDINQLVNGKTLLEWAVEFNRVDWVNGLLEEEADLTILTAEGLTALELARELGDREEIIALLKE